ncbi:non-ribosomal peptide synthetase [Streptomyces sp. NBC_00893]|uniref:non-ribosomal peptide synthetase n=1 Tax=Streptomyces sp. NBC_00893 TaxID=2975862 RepID=UPI002259D074|nr:non-ribosomal peptide synthetase [Streptomyces sp. NBC_00893]MCX4849413.1 amino acid adenylation domain-containing protein [Streptomyces sp. NBC_00893]
MSAPTVSRTVPVAASPSMADRFGALGREQRVRLLRRLLEAGRAREIPAVIPPRDPARRVPLSPAQHDLWVYDSLYPGTPALNLCAAYHFERPVDPAHLEEALTLIQRHHDILRTRIVTDPSGELHVEFPDDGRFDLEREELRGTGRTIDEAFETFRSRPFDLGRDKLIRARFVRVDERRSTLMLSLHHTISDWWSFDVLQNEFARAYGALRDGLEPPLTRPAVQYADFSSWQDELAESGIFASRLDFWRRYLADPPGPLTVPGSNGGVGGGEGIAQVPFHIDAPTTAAVRALARERGASVYVVLMAAFAVLAHRVSGADDLVIGTPIANRAAKGLDQVIGYVMNAVPTRWKVAPDRSFAELLAGFAVDFPDLMANADVPVGRIVSAAAPERSAGRAPLYQWVFMHLTQQPSVSVMKEFAEPERIHTGGEHDLVGVVKDSGDGMEGSFGLRTDVFDPGTVARWTQCYVELLKRITADPNALVGDIDVVPSAMRGELLAGSAGPVAPAPVPLPRLVTRQAARTPDAPAVESPGRTLSYAQLDDRVARLAGRLVRRGAGPGRIVALALARGSDWPVAALAVQRAGAAYLPVDPAHPAERIRRVLADAAPALLVTEPGAAPLDTGLPTLVLDEDAWAGESLPPGGPEPHDAAHVIHTSGSTGTPKGVVVSHAGVAALTRSLVDGLALDADSRVLQLGPPSFDISVGELCLAFGSGGTLVLPEPGPLVGEDLGTVLAERRISCAFVPPSVLATVPAAPYPELRALVVGAEACPPELVARWAVAGRRFHNAYGPTESTVVSTVSGPLDADGTAPPIGTPVAGTTAYLLDELLRPVPAGAGGELYLAGGALARGYLGRAALTAERFVADPYGPPGSRMYRTGDLAHRDDHGNTYYLGRGDEQVKLRGLRIEPGEIAAALAEHPTVERAVAVVRHDRADTAQLVAYVVPAPGASVDEDALLLHASGRLPAAMVPAAVVALDALPLSSHGKLDRAALPAPAVRTAGTVRLPGSAREEVLCGLFAELLGVEQAGADDDFFRLGGDSIMAIQLAARARAAGLVLSPHDVFTVRTPARLAVLARTPEGDAPEEDTGTGRLPLTPVMHWWREQVRDTATFTQSMLFPLAPGTGLAAIEEAVRVLTERHAALRMRLVCEDDTGWELHVPEESASSAARAVRVAVPADADLHSRATELARTVTLRPEDGEMVRAVWLDPGSGRPGALLLTVHHLAVDGFSWRVLGQELGAALDGRSADDAAPARTASFTRWSRLLSREAVLRLDELPWWESQLADDTARLGDLPKSGGRRETLTFDLDPDLTRSVLLTLPGAFNCRPDAVMLTALTAAAVQRRGSGSSLVVHLEGHGREALSAPVDVSGTVGWFTTQYPVRLDLGAASVVPGGRPGEALKCVKEQLLAVPSGGLGWGLLRYLHPETGPALAALPAPDVRFNYLGRFAAADAAGGRLLEPGPDAVPLAHTLEVDVLAREENGEPVLEASFSYPSGVFTEDGMRALAGAWSEALRVLAEHCGPDGAAVHAPSDFPLVDLTGDQLELLAQEMDFGDLGTTDEEGRR